MKLQLAAVGALLAGALGLNLVCEDKFFKCANGLGAASAVGASIDRLIYTGYA